jgi:hypothetical protein
VISASSGASWIFADRVPARSTRTGTARRGAHLAKDVGIACDVAAAGARRRHVRAGGARAFVDTVASATARTTTRRSSAARASGLRASGSPSGDPL